MWVGIAFIPQVLLIWVVPFGVPWLLWKPISAETSTLVTSLLFLFGSDFSASKFRQGGSASLVIGKLLMFEITSDNSYYLHIPERRLW